MKKGGADLPAPLFLFFTIYYIVIGIYLYILYNTIGIILAHRNRQLTTGPTTLSITYIVVEAISVIPTNPNH